LINSLGITIWATGGVFGDTRWTNGLISKSFVDGNPIFDDTNVYVFSNFAPLQPGQINSPLYAETGGGVYSDGPFISPDGPVFGFDNFGPFWLYRAVPEPSSLLLIGIAATCTSSRRERIAA
jgi:hypothetical protein